MPRVGAVPSGTPPWCGGAARAAAAVRWLSRWPRRGRWAPVAARAGPPCDGWTRTATFTVPAGMLAVMTSLASAARSVPALSPSFNANFYIAAATVIPVLFVAVAVQGRAYGSLMTAFSDAFRRWMVPGQWARSLPAAVIAVTASAAAIAMLYSAVAEVLAIYALYQQQARSATAQNVFLAVTFMVIMTAAAPGLAFYRVVIVPLAHGSKWIFTGQGDTKAEPEAAAKAQETDAESPPPDEETEMGEMGLEG